MKYRYFYFFERNSYHGIFGPEKPVWIEGRLFTTIYGEHLQAESGEGIRKIWAFLSKEEYEAKLYK